MLWIGAWWRGFGHTSFDLLPSIPLFEVMMLKEVRWICKSCNAKYEEKHKSGMCERCRLWKVDELKKEIEMLLEAGT